MNENRSDEKDLFEKLLKRESRLSTVISVLSVIVAAAALVGISELFSKGKYFSLISVVTALASAVGGAAMNTSLNRVLKMANRLLHGDASEHSAKQLALSVLYLTHLSKKNQPIKLLLVVTGVVTASLGLWLANSNLYYLSSVTMATIVLMMTKEYIVGYRIRSGFFGTNRNEARDFLKFLVKNAADIDFTDSNGKLKQALNQPDALSNQIKRGAEGGATA